LADSASALVASIEGGSAIAIVDCPNEEVAVVGGAQTGKVLGIGTEGNASDTEGMVRETGKRAIRRGFFGGGEDEDAGFVACLRDC